MKIRLFIEGKHVLGSLLPLSSPHTHYLRNVLRKRDGTKIFIFNENEEEFEGDLLLVKNGAQIKISRILPRQPKKTNVRINLVFAWVKKDAVADILQKCTQIGINSFHPISTLYSNSTTQLTIKRAEKIIIEACEQSERNNIPQFHPTLSLKDFLQKNPNKNLFFCNENERLQDIKSFPELNLTEAFIIVGPEGGFSPSERELLQSYHNIHSISLGNYVLKSETACACAAFLVTYSLNKFHSPN